MKDIIAKTIGFKALNNMIQFQLSTKHANNIVSGIHATATALALLEYSCQKTSLPNLSSLVNGHDLVF